MNKAYLTGINLKITEFQSWTFKMANKVLVACVRFHVSVGKSTESIISDYQAQLGWMTV